MRKIILARRLRKVAMAQMQRYEICREREAAAAVKIAIERNTKDKGSL